MARKRFYDTPGKMQKKIDEYFKSCEGKPLMIDGEPYLTKEGQPVIIGATPPTVTGLALALGLASRQALINYQEREEFNDVVTRAKSRIEAYAESRLYDRDGQRGAEFVLRCGFKWDDKPAEEPSKQQDNRVFIPVVLPPNKPPEEPKEEDSE